jgi:nucleoside-diphosphate-sugar epimerase
MTIKDFAETILKLIDTKSEISYHPLPEDDPKQRRPNIKRAQEILKWEPKVPLKEGLARTLAYFQDCVSR